MKRALPAGGPDQRYAFGLCRELVARRLCVMFIGRDELPAGQDVGPGRWVTIAGERNIE